MFFSAEQVYASIKTLNNVHPFLGITFLTCKKHGLPVGSAIKFQLDAATCAFLLEYHRLSPNSKCFFQPFKSSGKDKQWVKPDYPAKGLQSINTRSFKEAFLHEKNSAIWGWHENYIEVLANTIPENQKARAFDLAVWLYKNEKHHEITTPQQLVEKFFSSFNITKKEKILFDENHPAFFEHSSFKATPPLWDEYRKLGLPEAPDALPERWGTLSNVCIKGVGPAVELEIEPGRRLTLIVGDNGLGKSFILDAAWWALTGTWAGLPIYPSTTLAGTWARLPIYPSTTLADTWAELPIHLSTMFPINPQISYVFTGSTSVKTKYTTTFNYKKYEWSQTKNRSSVTGLSVYARVDGSFAIWDPARHHDSFSEYNKSNISNEEAWNGAPGRIEGLIRDWVRWQNDSSGSIFKAFCQVLKALSPPDLGTIEPGEPVRIPGDLRQIPTIQHLYGSVPITCAAAGVKRVITLAYLIVWAWTEHKISSEQKSETPQRSMVVLVDELEAHLHPKWQRLFLPALLTISAILSNSPDPSDKNSLEIQLIVSTHSPLVMASAEAVFNPDSDRLFNLDINNGCVSLREHGFINYGDASAWLESPVFKLKYARSVEAEKALEKAKALQIRSQPASEHEVREVNERLKQHLAADDRFWPRWVGFAAKFGVEV